MLMESVQCAFIPNGGANLGTIEEVGCGSPAYRDDLYAPTTYSETGYASSPVQDSGYISANYEDSNNNPFTYPDPTSYNQTKLNSSLISGLSDMKLSSSEPPSPYDLPATNPKSGSKSGKKNSRSKANKNADSDRNRKDSFVYDVRLPDEQFLFFVPDMDLVKSHLMFAVREEVEVLKEKILELMDQISSLECENTLLRQYAPPEALQQIQPSLQQQQQPGNLSQQQIVQPPHHGGSS